MGSDCLPSVLLLPQVNLQTTGQGSVRFNPNLYNCGKVCLSLLGTWRGGGGNEGWTEKSTLWQVLVSIQSAILGSELPYYNEPGLEGERGTKEGFRSSQLYSEGARVLTLQTMLQVVRSPPKSVEGIVVSPICITVSPRTICGRA